MGNKKKTCSIQEATEWFEKSCPNMYKQARGNNVLTREAIIKAVEILKANNHPSHDYEVLIMPGSYAYEWLKANGYLPETDK